MPGPTPYFSSDLITSETTEEGPIGAKTACCQKKEPCTM